jgi:hypothetical protein
MNRSLTPDFIIVVSHFEPEAVILLGDTKQPKSVAAGPNPPSGFPRELEVSVMAYFLEAYWPAVEIFVQRRSRTGIMEIPTLRYYRSEVVEDRQPSRTPFTRILRQLWMSSTRFFSMRPSSDLQQCILR